MDNFLRGILNPGCSDGLDVNRMVKAITNPSAHGTIGIKNRIQMKVVGPDGRIKHRVDKVENVLCSYGLGRLCQLIATGGEASNWANNYKIGTSTVAAASTQDTLGASTASVALGGGSLSASSQGARTLRYLATFASNNPAGAAAINEVGLFQSTGNASMIARSVLGTASVNKGASDQIQISHDIIFKSAS